MHNIYATSPTAEPSRAEPRRQPASVSRKFASCKKRGRKKEREKNKEREGEDLLRAVYPAIHSRSRIHFALRGGTLRYAASVRYISSRITTLYLRSIPEISDVRRDWTGKGEGGGTGGGQMSELAARRGAAGRLVTPRLRIRASASNSILLRATASCYINQVIFYRLA